MRPPEYYLPVIGTSKRLLKCGSYGAQSTRGSALAKNKRTAEAFDGRNWVPCPICSGRYVDYNRKKLKVGANKVSICPWCFTRGGKYLILFIQFVEQFGKRPCESGYVLPYSQEALECKCPPCTANKILNYRTRLVGTQVAPVKG